MASTKTPRTSAPKTHRLDARIDAETDERLARAAAVNHESVSSFVARAVRAETDRVLGRADVTIMDPQLFDSLVSSLDTADAAPGLAALGEQRRRYRAV